MHISEIMKILAKIILPVFFFRLIYFLTYSNLIQLVITKLLTPATSPQILLKLLNYPRFRKTPARYSNAFLGGMI
jgi:hypothetical protein